MVDLAWGNLRSWLLDIAAFLKNKKVIPGLVTGVRWSNPLFLVPFPLEKKMHASLPIDRQPVVCVAMLKRAFL